MRLLFSFLLELFPFLFVCSVTATHTHVLLYLIEDEKNVVERNRADEVEKEPGAKVMAGNQFRVEDNLLRIVLMHYT